MPGFSDVCKLLQQHVPYGDPHTYDFPTMKVVLGDPPNSDDPTTRTCVNVFSALREYGDDPPCPNGRLQVQLVNGIQAVSIRLAVYPDSRICPPWPTPRSRAQRLTSPP